MTNYWLGFSVNPSALYEYQRLLSFLNLIFSLPKGWLKRFTVSRTEEGASKWVRYDTQGEKNNRERLGQFKVVDRVSDI